MPEEPLSYSSIVKAMSRIEHQIHRTPVMTSSLIDAATKKSVFFKCEHLQIAGSFKTRGALNSVKKLMEDGKLGGVVTWSTGNHAQSLAWAAAKYDLPCIVVVPDNTPATKLAAIEAYKAQLHVVPSSMNLQDRLDTCERLAKKSGYQVIDPHNDHNVMSGQGTIAIEFLDQVKDLDAVLVPIGGGGILAGIATYIAHVQPELPVFCVAPEAKDLERSLRAGKRLWPDMNGFIETIADAIRVVRVGDKCFPYLVDNVQHTVLVVNDEEIADAMQLMWSRLKQTVETASASCLAAIFRHHALLEPYERIGVVLTGGNVDFDRLPFRKQ